MAERLAFLLAPPTNLGAYQLMLHQYLRFVVTGALAIGTYLALFEAFRALAVMPLSAATGAAYLLASGLNYWLNYNWSFASQQPHTSALMKYAVIALLGVSMNAAVVPILVTEGLTPLLAGFSFAITWPIVSFFAQKYWAFKEVS